MDNTGMKIETTDGEVKIIEYLDEINKKSNQMRAVKVENNITEAHKDDVKVKRLIPNAWILNCDGSYQKDLALAGVGGVIKNPDGVPIAMYSEMFEDDVTVNSSSQAEWTALSRGLDMAIAVGAERLEIHMDSMEIVDNITRKLAGIEEIQHQKDFRDNDVLPKLAKMHAFAVKWVARDLNQEADLLSRADRLRRAMSYGVTEIKNDYVIEQARYVYNQEKSADPKPVLPRKRVSPTDKPLIVAPRSSGNTAIEGKLLREALKEDRWVISIAVNETGEFQLSTYSWIAMSADGEQRMEGVLHKEMGVGRQWLKTKALEEAILTLYNNGVDQLVYLTDDPTEYSRWTSGEFAPNVEKSVGEGQIKFANWVNENIDMVISRGPVSESLKTRVREGLKDFNDECAKLRDQYAQDVQEWRNRQKERGLRSKEYIDLNVLAKIGNAPKSGLG